MDSQAIIEALPLGVAGVALVAALLAHARLARARRSLKLLEGSFEGKTLLDAVISYAGEVKRTQQSVRAVGQRNEELFGLLARSARNLGLVRFDAFEEMGGRLSFSAALLNDFGTGVVLTSINGRSESRVYAKEVVEGASEHTLSPEEQKAMAEALGRKRKVGDRG